MTRKLLLYLFALLLLVLVAPAQNAHACGGLFCQNSPVSQNAERIIFTENEDGSTSAIIQIQYTGEAPDFSWILPISTPISAEDIEVPDDAMEAFVELQQMTTPRFIPPPMPQCARDMEMEMVMSESMDEDGGGVEVFASGEVGPFGFDVIGSSDPNALINWLRENKYRVEEPMEPLINVYVEEEFFFLAMKLLPDAGVDEIAPIKITYDSPDPMIPIRLTAVAANPNMAVLVWFFASAQAQATNYEKIEIADEEITFFVFGGHNYWQILQNKADAVNGLGFITEYALPTGQLAFTNPLLQELSGQYNFLTRLNTFMDPEQMTVDPIFAYDSDLPEQSNVHDLSEMSGVWECEDEIGIVEQVANVITGEESASDAPQAVGEGGGGIGRIEIIIVVAIFAIGLGFLLGRRKA